MLQFHAPTKRSASIFSLSLFAGFASVILLAAWIPAVSAQNASVTALLNGNPSDIFYSLRLFGNWLRPTIHPYVLTREIAKDPFHSQNILATTSAYSSSLLVIAGADIGVGVVCLLGVAVYFILRYVFKFFKEKHYTSVAKDLYWRTASWFVFIAVALLIGLGISGYAFYRTQQSIDVVTNAAANAKLSYQSISPQIVNHTQLSPFLTSLAALPLNLTLNKFAFAANIIAAANSSDIVADISNQLSSAQTAWEALTNSLNTLTPLNYDGFITSLTALSANVSSLGQSNISVDVTVFPTSLQFSTYYNQTKGVAANLQAAFAAFVFYQKSGATVTGDALFFAAANELSTDFGLLQFFSATLSERERVDNLFSSQVAGPIGSTASRCSNQAQANAAQLLNDTSTFWQASNLIGVTTGLLHQLSILVIPFTYAVLIGIGLMVFVSGYFVVRQQDNPWMLWFAGILTLFLTFLWVLIGFLFPTAVVMGDICTNPSLVTTDGNAASALSMSIQACGKGSGMFNVMNLTGYCDANSFFGIPQWVNFSGQALQVVSSFNLKQANSFPFNSVSNLSTLIPAATPNYPKTSLVSQYGSIATQMNKTLTMLETVLLNMTANKVNNVTLSNAILSQRNSIAIGLSQLQTYENSVLSALNALGNLSTQLTAVQSDAAQIGAKLDAVSQQVINITKTQIFPAFQQALATEQSQYAQFFNTLDHCELSGDYLNEFLLNLCDPLLTGIDTSWSFEGYICVFLLPVIILFIRINPMLGNVEGANQDTDIQAFGQEARLNAFGEPETQGEEQKKGCAIM